MFGGELEVAKQWYSDRFGWEIPEVDIVPIPEELVDPRKTAYFLMKHSSDIDLDEAAEAEERSRRRVVDRIQSELRIPYLQARAYADRAHPRFNDTDYSTGAEKLFTLGNAEHTLYVYPLFYKGVDLHPELGRLLAAKIISHELFHVMQAEHGVSFLKFASEGSAQLAEKLFGSDVQGPGYWRSERDFNRLVRGPLLKSPAGYAGVKNRGERFFRRSLGVRQKMSPEESIDRFSRVFDVYERVDSEIWYSYVQPDPGPGRQTHFRIDGLRKGC